MKKALALLLALVMVLSLAACGAGDAPATEAPKVDTPVAEEPKADAPAEEPKAEEGKVFNIYAWNEEFKGFFEKYYTVPEGVTVNWIINPSDGGVYQDKLDAALMAQADAAAVQEAVADWAKFDAVAATAKEKGYYMTASYVETYRTFSNNCTMAWVDEENNLQFDPMITTYLAQAKNYLDNGYTLTSGVWDDEKNQQMFADGKTMCFFGPAWYYNFSMGNAQDPEKGCSGDWAICQGPQAYFWGGTWLLAATGTDNPSMVADIMNTFTINEEVCSALVENEMQFSNNTNVNQKFAEDPEYGNAFLGGQNDVAVFVELAKNIKFENKTIYDQLLTEGLQGYWREYCDGTVSEEEAMANYYKYINEKYPEIITP